MQSSHFHFKNQPARQRGGILAGLAVTLAVIGGFVGLVCLMNKSWADVIAVQVADDTQDASLVLASFQQEQASWTLSDPASLEKRRKSCSDLEDKVHYYTLRVEQTVLKQLRQAQTSCDDHAVDKTSMAGLTQSSK